MGNDENYDRWTIFWWTILVHGHQLAGSSLITSWTDDMRGNFVFSCLGFCVLHHHLAPLLSGVLCSFGSPASGSPSCLVIDSIICLDADEYQERIDRLPYVVLNGVTLSSNLVTL